MPSSVESSTSGNMLDLGDDGIAALNEEDGNLEDNLEDDVVESEDEEDNVDIFIEASGCEPKAKEDIRGWGDLRVQIKANLEAAHKHHDPLTQINKLLVLRNFATLRIRGEGRIDASIQVAKQWQDGVGTNFARRIRFLARHYQLFEQLPPENRGKYTNRSLLSDKQVQTAARMYLTSLPTGEVTPSRFHRMLNEHIPPSLGYNLRTGLSERTARRWLVNLGWRNKLLRKGVYMDGHERPDVVEYRKSIFLPLMASYQGRMAKWEPQGSQLVRVDPVLGPGEKQVIVVFQDESCFHVNEYKRTLWCVLMFLFPGEGPHNLGKVTTR